MKTSHDDRANAPEIQPNILDALRSAVPRQRIEPTPDKPTVNLFAERALLGRLLAHRDKYGPDTAARFVQDSQLSRDLFTDPTCRDLFTAISDLLNRGESPDLAAMR